MIAHDPPRPRPRIRALAVLVYGAMALAAGIIAWARGVSLVAQPASLPELDSLGASLALGAGLAAVMIGGTRVLVLRSAWGRMLRDEFRTLLGGASPTDTLWLAVLSGIGEELLFRGALRPWWGLGASSLAFGILHVGPSRRFLGWTLWASGLGLLLGLLCETTGRIEGAVLAHVAINAVNLRFVVAFDGRLDTPRGGIGEQSLVGRRARRDSR